MRASCAAHTPTPADAERPRDGRRDALGVARVQVCHLAEHHDPISSPQHSPASPRAGIAASAARLADLPRAAAGRPDGPALGSPAGGVTSSRSWQASAGDPSSSAPPRAARGAARERPGAVEQPRAEGGRSGIFALAHNRIAGRRGVPAGRRRGALAGRRLALEAVDPLNTSAAFQALPLVEPTANGRSPAGKAAWRAATPSATATYSAAGTELPGPGAASEPGSGARRTARGPAAPPATRRASRRRPRRARRRRPAARRCSRARRPRDAQQRQHRQGH